MEPRLQARGARGLAFALIGPEFFPAARASATFLDVQAPVPVRARATDLAAGALLVASFLALVALLDRIATGSNPDQWFHFAISRMSQAGLVRALPQAEDVGWGSGFPEKEFLFHRLTALAYAAGGERAIQVLCRALSCGSILLVYWLARRAAAPPIAAASTFALTIANPYLLFRLGMVRPHVLAVFLFLAVIAALVCRWRVLGFLAGTAFALAYHAVYVPAALAIAFAAVALIQRRVEPDAARTRFAVSLAVLVGIVTGIAVNPYFPSNVVMGWAHLGFALSSAASLPGVHVGAEVLPLSASTYLRLFGIPLAAAIGCAVALIVDARSGEKPWDRAILTAAALFLVGAAARSVRAVEYGSPLLAVCVAQVLGDARRSRRARIITTAALLLAAPWPLVAQLRRPPDLRHQQIVRDLFAAISAIPPEASGRKVFDCDWNYGSFLLYARPDLRFVDLLDPRFLLVNPDLFDAKRQLDLDTVPAPARAMRVLFNADYALCANPALNRRLERDGVRVLFAARSGIRLYALP